MIYGIRAILLIIIHKFTSCFILCVCLSRVRDADRSVHKKRLNSREEKKKMAKQKYITTLDLVHISKVRFVVDITVIKKTERKKITCK